MLAGRWQIGSVYGKNGLAFGVVAGVVWFGAAVACSNASAVDARAARGGVGGNADEASAGGTSGAVTSNSGNGGAVTSSLGGDGLSGGSGGASASTAGSSGVAAGDGGSGALGGTLSPYDAAVLADRPVAFWAVDLAPASERDLTGNGHDGSYLGQGTPLRVTLPNGDVAQDFDGKQQYLSVPSSPVFSIPTTASLTWEGWIRPDVLQFPHDDGSSGYVDWLGKCERYDPTCEWEARMYDTTTKESPNRPNRLSAYVFNPSAGLGSAADFQPAAGSIMAGSWYHVVGEATTLAQPANCANTATAPGSIDIWVNGVKWDHASHGQTGCMSQYNVVPKASGSALNIGTMAKDTFFAGAIGKVAIYDHLLGQAQISSHYQVMTGKPPTGRCADTCSF